MEFTWETNPALRVVPGAYVEPCPRAVERDEPFPGAEACRIITAGQHDMCRFFLKIMTYLRGGAAGRLLRH